eukprot:917073-Pelagomonas_calceolata.AAC.3
MAQPCQINELATAQAIAPQQTGRWTDPDSKYLHDLVVVASQVVHLFFKHSCRTACLLSRGAGNAHGSEHYLAGLTSSIYDVQEKWRDKRYSAGYLRVICGSGGLQKSWCWLNVTDMDMMVVTCMQPTLGSATCYLHVMDMMAVPCMQATLGSANCYATFPSPQCHY